MISFRSQIRFDKQACLLIITEEQAKNNRYNFFNKELSQAITAVVQAEQFEASNGSLFPLFVKKQLVLLVGVGKSDKITPTALRVTLRKAFLSHYLKRIRDIEIVTHDQSDPTIKAILEAYLIGTYSWKKYMNKTPEDKTIPEKNLFIAAAQKLIFEEAIRICEGVKLARDLVNDNADIVTSEYIEKTVRHLIRGHLNARIEVLNRKTLASKGLNLHLAVNQGSPKDPKLIIVKYAGEPARKNYTALIGKGITFDTGGLNLKPSNHIETMRTDMSGAAAVIGTLKNVLELKLRKNIIFAVGIAENAIGSNAYKPGDVFRGYSGKTVEIGNTDAEGRLVLADAISYIVRNYKPARIIDIATLTGACVIALGHDYSGLVSNDDEFARQVIRCSNETDDRAWRLPSYPEIKDYIKSQYADIKNVGFPKGAAGALTAAEFLRQFTEDTPWVHLDVAGTAYVEGQERLYYGFGATGVGVRLLTDFIKKH